MRRPHHDTEHAQTPSPWLCVVGALHRCRSCSFFYLSDFIILLTRISSLSGRFISVLSSLMHSVCEQHAACSVSTCKRHETVIKCLCTSTLLKVIHQCSDRSNVWIILQTNLHVPKNTKASSLFYTFTFSLSLKTETWSRKSSLNRWDKQRVV